MRFPWGQKKEKVDNSVYVSTDTEREELYEIHKCIVCAEMARLLVKVTNLDICKEKVQTTEGNYLKYQLRSSDPVKEVITAFYQETGQKFTVHTESDESSAAIVFALDHSFPLEVSYIRTPEDEQLTVKFTEQLLEKPDESLVLNALRKAHTLLDADILEGEQLPRSSRNHKRTSTESNNVLKLVS